MNFREKLQTVLEKLGLMAKAKQNALTDEEWKQIVDSYKQEYKTTIQEDMAAENQEQAFQENSVLTQEQLNQLQGTLQKIVNPEASAEGQQSQDANADSLMALAGQLGSLVQALNNRAAEDRPETVVTANIVSYTGNADRSQFLFGIEHPMFSMNARWNKVAANPASAPSFGSWDEEIDGAAFRKEAVKFSRSLQKRYAFLHENGMLDAKRLASGEFGTNYGGVTDANVGNQYVVLRQDALIARVLQRRELTQWFPVRYGIQDHDLVFNAFFAEVSQAYQQGEIWKGDMKIENEMGHVDDAMIKMKFGPMKELERMYIGYLNREGSDPIKWSMIEFCILNSLETAQVEQNKRRMRGIYVKPETGVAGSYLNASTGIVYTLLRYIHENKILPHADADYRTYTQSTFLAAVQAFVADVTASCSEDMDLDRHVLYLNKTHQPWWIKNVRTAYGKDIDFQGPNSYLNVVPDTNTHIIWLPYLGKMPLMFMDIPGNLQFLEYVPGEMLSIKVKEDMELVKAWSTWKEGCAAAFVGRRFDTAAALLANNYEWQQIFINKPCVSLAKDATEPDADNGFWFLTIANDGTSETTGEGAQAVTTVTPPAITDIDNAKAGVAYIIECGSLTNATTIAKSGKFANIKSAWEPSAVGDYIMVILNSEGKFLELERQVGGTRTVNADLQPNIPGVR